MKKIITAVVCALLLTGCTISKEIENTELKKSKEVLESAVPTSTPTATPKPSATPVVTAKPTKKPEPTKSPEPSPSVKPTASETTQAIATPVPEVQQYQEPAYVEPEPVYTEPVWEEPVYYEEPVPETPTYTDGSVAATYNGQYPGTSCEGVAGLYLGGDMSYLLASYGYQVWDPVPGDVIAYFDSGWNYRHTAVFLGNGQALHGSYNADKSAQVASMYIGGYPNLCYYRIGGETCYTQFLNDIAHGNGGRAGWLEGITFPLG